MKETAPRQRSFGCSISSLLLLTSISAAVFALVGVAIRAPEMGEEGELGTPAEVEFGATVLLPFCGLLIGHIRFNRIRYVILGGLFGLLVGILLLAILSIPASSAPALVITTTVISLGLIVYGYYVRRASGSQARKLN